MGASTTVTVAGMRVVRAGDPCVMNGGNNPGIYTTVEPVAPNPAKSAAQTSDPPIVPATPQGAEAVGGWLNGVVDNIAAQLNEVTAIIEDWWAELQNDFGELIDRPWEGIQDGIEQILGMGMITDEVIKQYFEDFGIDAVIRLLGGAASAQQLLKIGLYFEEKGEALDLSRFENAPQANKSIGSIQAALQIREIIMTAPKLFAMFNAVTTTGAAAAGAGAAAAGARPAPPAGTIVSPGDGVIIKPAAAATSASTTRPGGTSAPGGVTLGQAAQVAGTAAAEEATEEAEEVASETAPEETPAEETPPETANETPPEETPETAPEETTAGENTEPAPGIGTPNDDVPNQNDAQREALLQAVERGDHEAVFALSERLGLNPTNKEYQLDDIAAMSDRGGYFERIGSEFEGSAVA
jgi:hypothetical protein